MFDWSDVSKLWVLNNYSQRNKIVKVGSINHNNTSDVDNTTEVFDEAGKKITSVFTRTGCGWGNSVAMHDHANAVYVFAKEDEVNMTVSTKGMTDEEVAAKLREAEFLYNEYHLELEDRGYTIYDKDGNDLCVVYLGKISKEITTEKVI